MNYLKIMELFQFNLNDKYYLESNGFNCNVPVYRDFTHFYAKIFFNILNYLNLDYYVFAGTSVGYLRNKKNIPWVDDYDIIIFEKEINKFENIILPKLKEFGFNCFTPIFCEKLIKNTVGYHVLSSFGQNIFQCDIFYSIIDNDGKVKNKNGWGLYNYKQLHIDTVKPKQYLTIDGDLTIPFFNDIKKDVEIEYGDVFNKIVINISHNDSFFINLDYKIVYEQFLYIKQKIINNTIQLIEKHQYINNLTLDNYDNFIKYNGETDNFNTSLNFLKYVSEQNVKNLYIFDERFLIFCVDLKFYFKDINIIFYLVNKLDNKNLILLNYIDKIFYSKEEYTYNLNYDNFYVLKKPIIEQIKVITFGTFDLFHIGHINILKRAKEYGQLVVGVSTDELNKKKGKLSVNDLEKRKLHVLNSNYVDIIFNEEELELKTEYVNKYNCNLLIMGDDWKDKFNFCDCACIYLSRTPDISTTLLKEQLVNKLYDINANDNHIDNIVNDDTDNIVNVVNNDVDNNVENIVNNDVENTVNNDVENDVENIVNNDVENNIENIVNDNKKS